MRNLLLFMSSAVMLSLSSACHNPYAEHFYLTKGKKPSPPVEKVRVLRTNPDTARLGGQEGWRQLGSTTFASEDMADEAMLVQHAKRIGANVVLLSIKRSDSRTMPL